MRMITTTICGPKDTAFQQSGCKLYQPFLPYQRLPQCHSFQSCQLSFPSCGWQSEYFWRGTSNRIQVRHRCVHAGAGASAHVLKYLVMNLYGQTPSRWFLCWTHGRHRLWVIWGSSLGTWEEGLITTTNMVLRFSFLKRLRHG